MTALTPAQIAWLRSTVGQVPDDAALQSKFDRLNSVRDVAIEVLRDRRAEWLRSPLSVNVSGIASLSFAENVKALERLMSDLIKQDDDPSDDPGGGGPESGQRPFSQTQLVRPRRR